MNQEPSRPMSAARHAWRDRAKHAAAAAFVLAVFGGAIWLLHREMGQYSLHDIEKSLVAISPLSLAKAVAFAVASYILLTGYDWLALAYLERRLPYPQVALASFVSFVAGYNFGATLGGTTMRFRIYSSWGFSSVEIMKIIGLCAVTFLLGLGTLAGSLFVVESISLPDRLKLPLTTTQPIGIVLLLAVAVYFAACIWYRRPLRIRNWQFTLPGPVLTLKQSVIAVVEIGCAGGVLYVLLPASIEVSYFELLAMFLLAMVIGDVSHVPGGLGVFEAMMLVLLDPADPPALLGSLLAFRAVYDLFPLGVAAALLAVHEAAQRRKAITRFSGWFTGWSRLVVPRVLALTTFCGGAVLLLSGAMPRAAERLDWMQPFVPLPVVEVSHFMGGLIGVALLILARGIQQRLDVAYHLSVILLAAGILISLIKGFDYQEAIVLLIMLALLVPCRSQFDRRASLLTERFTAGWIVAVVLVFGATVWLALFSHKHVDYAHELWWRFALDHDAPRALRATVAGSALLLFVGALRLMRPAQPTPHLPGDAELTVAASIVDSSRRASDNLALVGDKALLFNGDRSGFVMYGVQASSWIAMGDPVGPSDRIAELAWQFHELAARHARMTVFYEVSRDALPIYLDLGLTTLKLGEEARVSLKDFTLAGKRRHSLRQSYNRACREGLEFEIIPRDRVTELLPRLREISDTWLSTKNAREKGFSLGFFDETYVARTPAAIIRHESEIVAFANIWSTSKHDELTIDLMRYLPTTPPGVMDYLFVELMNWGKAEGYRAFSLGMAPLAGLEKTSMAPVWNRVGTMLFQHGEHFYNFQGLRRYKDKFGPVWEDRYLASPGGLRLPTILMNVSALISGSFTGALSKRG